MVIHCFICSGFAENWDNICQSDFGGLCCAPGMENSRYFMAEYPASWMQHEGDCKDLGGQLVAFETRAEMDCVIQYMEDKFPVSTYPFSWAIGLASSYRYKGMHDVTLFRAFSDHSKVNMYVLLLLS